MELIMKSRTQLLGMLCSLSGAVRSLHALALERSLVAAGVEIYTPRCASCHGEDLNNVSGGWSFDCGVCDPTSMTDLLIR
jgi:hypothetical protein